MKQLILITNQFPYLSAEPFLENEIPYLSKVFEEIYVFSIDAGQDEAQTRPVPTNVKCFPMGGSSSRLKYIKYGAKGVFSGGKRFKIREKNAKRIVASCYTRGRGAAIAKQIHTLIKNEKLSVKDAVVYSFWFTYQAVAAVLLADLLQKDGCRVSAVSRAHGYDIYWERVSGGYLPFQRALLQELKCCYPCSDFGRNYLLGKYPETGSKLVTSRLGTKDYGVGPYAGEKVLVTCSNLEPLKRVSLFAKAFCRLCREIPDVRWICIGTGEEKDLISETVRENSCEEKIQLLGRLPNKEVLEFYRKNAVQYFVNVSTTEGVPVTVMEAMSFGIPVIATDVGGTHELVDFENGCLMNADLDEEALCAKLKEMLLLHEDDYLKLRTVSRRKWERLASADVNYTEFAKQLVSF